MCLVVSYCRFSTLVFTQSLILWFADFALRLVLPKVVSLLLWLGQASRMVFCAFVGPSPCCSILSPYGNCHPEFGLSLFVGLVYVLG